MGIFSRLFQGGQEERDNPPGTGDLSPPEAPAPSPAAPSDSATASAARAIPNTPAGGDAVRTTTSADNGTSAERHAKMPSRIPGAVADVVPRSDKKHAAKAPESNAVAISPTPVPTAASAAASLRVPPLRTPRVVSPPPARRPIVPAPRPPGTAATRTTPLGMSPTASSARSAALAPATAPTTPAATATPAPSPPCTAPAPEGGTGNVAAAEPRRTPAPRDAAADDGCAASPATAAPAPDASPEAAPSAPPTTHIVHGAGDAVAPALNGGEARSTAHDLASVRVVFEEIAAVHVAHVRDVMLELRFGDVPPSLIQSSLPALRSLRAMAAQMELDELCAALDDFCRVVGEQRQDVLLCRYQRLIELIPQAFELDAERDRREPIIVASLLEQVDGVEKPIIDKLFAVGLSRLDALMRASPEEMAVVAGIRRELADRIVERFRSYRANANTAVSAPDAASAQTELRRLVAVLREHHKEFERAATGWSEESRARKRTERKEREQTFLRIKVALARLGERERIYRLERLPYQQRIDEIEAYVARMAHHAPPTPAAVRRAT